MTVDMGVYSVESFKNLADQDWEGFRKGHAWHFKSASSGVKCPVNPTNPTREHRLVVDITLDPGHQMLDVFGCWHFCRSLETLRILPKILEPIPSAEHEC